MTTNMTPKIVSLLSGSPVQTWPDLNLTPNLIDGGGADTGGPNQFKRGTSTWTPGNPAVFQTSPVQRPAGQPWDNEGYRYGTMTRDPKVIANLTSFMHQWSFMYATQADIDADNADEFEVESCQAGVLFNMAWQIKPSSVDGPPAYRMFDRHAGKWIAVAGIPAPKLSPGVWTTIKAYFTLDPMAGLVYHEFININGVSYVVGSSHPTLVKWSGSTWYIHHACQPDSMGKGQGRRLLIKDWLVRAL